MSKNYLPDIVVIRKPFAFIKKIFVIIMIFAVLVGTFLLADLCSGALAMSTLGLNITNNERINIDKHTLYAISMSSYDDKESAEHVALGLQVQGAAGYIWQSSNKYLVLGSIYDTKSKAESVVQ